METLNILREIWLKAVHYKNINLQGRRDIISHMACLICIYLKSVNHLLSKLKLREDASGNPCRLNISKIAIHSSIASYIATVLHSNRAAHHACPHTLLFVDFARNKTRLYIQNFKYHFIHFSLHSFTTFTNNWMWHM